MSQVMSLGLSPDVPPDRTPTVVWPNRCGRQCGQSSLKGLEGSRRALSDPQWRKVTVTIFCWSCFLYPVRQVSHKVKEEISLGDADDLGDTAHGYKD